MSKHLQRDLDNLQRDLLALASSVEEAIHKSIRSLQERQISIARQVIDGDSIIDELIATMRQAPDMVEPGLSFFSATRHLERIADHATNIAEDVVYLVEGEIIRHRPAAVELGPG